MGIWLDMPERARLLDTLIAAWPGGKAPGLRWLGEGFGSAAFESDDGLVVLVAKNPIGAHSRRVTCALTPELAAMLPIAIPLPLWAVQSAPGLPFGAYAYNKLSGRNMNERDAAKAPAAVAEKVASFLFVMHGYPVTRAIERGLPGFDELREDLASLRAYTRATVRQHLTPGEDATVQAWWDSFLQDEASEEAPRCLVHGDLWPQNMMVDEDGLDLLGVLDFGDVQVIDAAYDFAPLRLSQVLFNGVFDAYQRLGGVIDGAFHHRVQRWWELRAGSWYSLRAAIRTDDAAEIEDAIEQLRRSPILAPSRLDKW